MTAKIRLQGRRRTIDDSTESALPTSSLIRSEVTLDVACDAGARSGGERVEAPAQGNDLLEVDLGGGLVLWTTVEQYLEDTSDQPFKARARSPQDLPLEYPVRNPRGTRGRVAWAVQGLKTVGVDLVEIGADATIDLVAEKIEDDRLAKTGDEVGGLFRFDGQVLGEAVTSAEQIATGDRKKPILVFVHGTFSTTPGSFASLKSRQPASWQRLVATYGDRIYGFDHRSITQSPVENARDLMALLPADTPVHLISHSRGGLVGELLCAGRGAKGRDEPVFDAHAIALFDQDVDQQALRTLNDAFKERGSPVERFVRVACPARGTTLMEGRFDLWLSVVINVTKASAKALGKALGVPTGGLAGDLADVASIAADVLAAAAKLRADPTKLPGLESMLVTSPTVKLLNTFRTVEADLTVVSGDFEGSGIAGRVAEFVSDRYFGEDHDLVVPTASMKRGIRRPEGRLFHVPKVTHGGYFSHPHSAAAIADALQPQVPAGFDSLRGRGQAIEAVHRGAGEGEPAIDATKPWLYVLPGILGSNLSVDDNEIWLDFFDLARGCINQLASDAEGVEATSLNGGAYGKFVEYARKHFNVVPYAYDWRLSLEALGDQLADELEDALRQAEQPLHVIAHSMGGLVTRAMMARRPEVWDRLVANGGRLVMAGTPNAGSYATVRALLGRGKMISLLALLDQLNSKEQLLDVVNEYQGYLQLLPQPGSEPHQQADHFALAIWREYRELRDKGWSVPNGNMLRQAGAAIGRVLEEPLRHPERIKYVAGFARETPAGIRLEGGKIKVVGSRRGDGTVLWDGGIPQGTQAWYVRTKHGNLLDHKRSFSAYRDLLKHGATSELSQEPPVARASDEPFFIEDDPGPQYFPDEDAIFDEYLGGEPEGDAGDATPVQVSVVHADLRWAKHPVLIGHYLDDGIYNAEQALDETLGYRLSHRLSLDDYPGRLGSAEVFFADERAIEHNRKGAVVVGLGVIGDLQPQALVMTLARGMRNYAARCGELTPSADGLSLTALLIASGEGGVGAKDSLRALLSAVHLTNLKIEEVNKASANGDAGQRHLSPITHLEVYELFHDRAVQAQHYLRELGAEARFAPWLVAEEHLTRGKGGRRRMVFETRNAWWTRLTIERLPSPTDPDGQPLGFKFTALADRARSAEHRVTVQWRLIDELLANARSGDREALCDRQALFELMLPHDFKRAAAEGRNVVLVVDAKAASYPWELFLDRGLDADRDAGPAHTGLLRSLREERPRAITHASELSAFVLGDPTPADDPDFAQLEGARREALAVVERLQGSGWDAKHSLVRGRAPMDTADVLCGLFKGDYRLLHLAGHGVFDPDDPTRSGMIIGPVEGDTYEERAASRPLLTPGEIHQLPVTPELVFINCCYLGAIDDPDAPGQQHARADRHLLAGNLATEFIRMGVKAVVATGWEVDDGAAQAFADVFYEKMLAGENFGDAVIDARNAAYAEAPFSNTWAAYQCYGNPQFRLVVRENEQGQFSPGRYVDPGEAVVDLENLSAMVQQGEDDARDYCRRGAERLVQALPESWRVRSDINAALGELYGDLGDFEAAIDCYTKAIANAAEGSTVPIRAIEQRGNLRARWAGEVAWELAERGELTPQAKEEALERVERSMEELQHLMAIATTTEREALLASAQKSMAIVQLLEVKGRGLARRKVIDALVAMAKSYRAVAAQKPQPDLYTQTNSLVGLALLYKLSERDYAVGKHEFPSLRALQTECDEVLSAARQQSDNAAHFWDMTYVLDALTAKELISRGRIRTEAVKERTERREALFASSLGAVRQWRSVERQERFVELVKVAAEQGN
ncbi:MAG: CHAT domain-containing protein [Pseudomonadota bacterium]